MILKKIQQTTKPWQITSKAKRGDKLKWKVLHVHAGFMLKAYICLLSIRHRGAQWLSGRVLDSRPKGRGFEPHRRHCVVSLSKNINPSLVLVQPRKIRPFITERLLMGRKESNQTNNTARSRTHIDFYNCVCACLFVSK